MVYALAANALSSHVPPLTDEIALTALGEKDDASEGYEVIINGFSIDGQNYLVDKVAEGKWFWRGDQYMWRPETDIRQPEGTTNSVTLEIPVGWSRAILFSGNSFRGKVEVDSGTDTVTLDTYAEQDKAVSFDIGRSNISALVFNQVRRLSVYAFVFLLLCLSTAGAVVFYLHDREKSLKLFSKYNGRIIYAAIAFVTCLLMISYADRTSLWLDELFEVNFTSGSLRRCLQLCLTMTEASPPLALLLSNIWYHIAPYGEKWLLLMPIVLTSVAIYMMGVTGEKINGKYCGLFAVVLTAFSTTVWAHEAYEFRAYPVFFLTSVLSIHYYVKYNESGHGRREGIMFGVSMAALAMTHYFGMLACAGFFAADVYLYCRKRANIKNAIPYLFPGLLSVLWIGAVLVVRKEFVELPWQVTPNFSHINNAIQWISGNHQITYWLLLIGISAGVTCAVSSREFVWKGFYYRFFSLMIVGTIMLMVAYAHLLDPTTTLWNNRYFVFLIPCAGLLSAIFLSDFCKLLGASREMEKIVSSSACLFFAALLFLNCVITESQASSTEPFREAAQWLSEQGNYIYEPDTLIISTSADAVTKGWEEYYITRQWTRDDWNVITQFEVTEELLSGYNRVYVQYCHDPLKNDIQKYLEDNYELEVDNTRCKVKAYVS